MLAWHVVSIVNRLTRTTIYSITTVMLSNTHKAPRCIKLSPYSSYSALVTHMFLNVAKLAKIDPPAQAELILSGGAEIRIQLWVGALTRVSVNNLSPNLWIQVLPRIHLMQTSALRMLKFTKKHYPPLWTILFPTIVNIHECYIYMLLWILNFMNHIFEDPNLERLQELMINFNSLFKTGEPLVATLPDLEVIVIPF